MDCAAKRSKKRKIRKANAGFGEPSTIDTSSASHKNSTSNSSSSAVLIASKGSKRKRNHATSPRDHGRCTPSKELKWNFDTDYNDHFETPLIAYKDLLPVLHQLAAELEKPSEELVVYDPYFCTGRTVQMFERLGLKTVINRNRDFYEDIRTRKTPDFDILVTNPPYSGDHKQRLLQFLAKQPNKPFALLLPAYTATKSYWREFTSTATRGDTTALYLMPPESYHYCHPEGTGKSTPPFYSAWFLGNFEEMARYPDCCATT